MATLSNDLTAQLGFSPIDATVPQETHEETAIAAPKETGISLQIEALPGPSFDQPGVLRAPYLDFFHPLKSRASEFQEALGPLESGQAILVYEDRVIKLVDWKFAVFANFPYWCHFNKETFEETRHTFKAPPMKSDLQSRIVTVLIIDDGADFYATTTTFKNWTKERIVLSHLGKLHTATYNAVNWVRYAPDEGSRKSRAAVVQATQGAEYLRLWGKVRISERSQQNGRGKYQFFDSISLPANEVQIARYAQWLFDKGSQEISLALDAYNDRLGYISSLVK